jgi:RNA polymerase sigma-70 factor, ECF subfamily
MEPEQAKGVVKNGKPGGDGQVEYVDTDLIRRTRAGDREAFEELFNRYQKRVYNLIYRIIGNESDSSDLTQEVFVRVYNSIGKLRTDEAFFSWVRTVAVNLCRDFIRRRPARTESLDARLETDDGQVERELPDPSAGPERLLLDSDRKRVVDKAVASLSDEHRTVIVLHHLQGMDVQEIARTLDAPVGTIKSRLARARDELRRKLGAYVDVGS